jgi:DNA-binding IscR family transcriptional regulator
MSVRDATLKILSETTIADLIKKEKDLSASENHFKTL